MGSAALDLAWAAAGRYDGYFERGVKHWDIVAGALICARAGLTVRELPAAPPAEHGVLRRRAGDRGRAVRARHRVSRRAGGYGRRMTIVAVVVFCVLLLVLAFLLPRLSRGPERGGRRSPARRQRRPARRRERPAAGSASRSARARRRSPRAAARAGAVATRCPSDYSPAEPIQPLNDSTRPAEPCLKCAARIGYSLHRRTG